MKKGGACFKEFGPLFSASGGFGADFTQNSLLATFRPDLLHLPTTNGEHCTGDVTNMGEAIGTITIASHRLGEAIRPLLPKSSSFHHKRSAELAEDVYWIDGRTTLSGEQIICASACFLFFASWLDRATTLLQGPRCRCRWLNWSASLSRRSLAVV